MSSEMIVEVQKIDNLLNENDLFGEVYLDSDLPVIHIKINGDWKHDHLFLKNLLRERGYAYVGSHTTSDNGSDWYEAIHSVMI
mgnify:CR=1 FL=1